MAIIEDLFNLREEKVIQLEQQLLDLFPSNQLHQSLRCLFPSNKIIQNWLEEKVVERCYYVAIEAYLIGGMHTKFFRYKESVSKIKVRCEAELNQIEEMLVNILDYYGYDVLQEEREITCNNFIIYWWEIGLKQGLLVNKHHFS